MLGFNSDDFRGLIGQEIVQVRISRNQFIIILNSGCSISIESILDFYQENKELLLSSNNELIFFENILDKKIVNVEIISKKQAQFALDNGQFIKLVDSNVNYESITFNLKEKTIVV